MISMKEIAAEAGVSRTTVSFVLNGRHERDLKISTEVVEKVKRTAEKLGYVRNELVQSLVKGKSKVIAIIAHFSDFMMPIIRGYSETAAKYGYSISLISLNENCTLNQALMTAVEYPCKRDRGHDVGTGGKSAGESRFLSIRDTCLRSGYQSEKFF